MTELAPGRDIEPAQPDPAAPVRGGFRIPLPRPDPERMRQFWPKFWRTLGRVPFSEDLVSAWYCWADPKTPPHVKAVLAGALVYFVVPTDMVPDVIAGLGFTDDATVMATAVGLAGAHIRRRHKQAARLLLRKAQKAEKAEKAGKAEIPS